MAALWLTLKKVATKFPHFSLLPEGIEFHDHYSIELSVLQGTLARERSCRVPAFKILFGRVEHPLVG